MDFFDFRHSAPLFAAVPLLVSCSLFSIPGEDAGDVPGQGLSGLRISFNRDSVQETKAVSESIDTNSFLLDIRDSGGGCVYSGRYGDSPVSFDLPSGSYTVRAVSSEFKAPAFSCPQYGDEQCVVVPEGKVTGVRLNCTMMNCGIALNVASGFLTQYPKSSLFVKSDEGRLPYSYTERRIAYFKPGKVSLLMTDGIENRTIATRRLSAGDVLRLSVKVSGGAGPGQAQDGGVRISVDTAKNWISGSVTIGGGTSSGGGSEEDEGTEAGAAGAVTIAMAKELVGETDVWVGGYVVGGDLTSAKASFVPPFSSRSNLLIGPRSSVTSREDCLSVQLPEGDVRDGLNLVDNSHLLGRQVLLCGDIVESYYGMAGMKNVSDFILK